MFLFKQNQNVGFYRLYRLFSEKYRLLFRIKVFKGFYRFIGFTLMPACGTSWHLLVVQVDMGTSWHGYELTWVRVDMGTSWHGYELTWGELTWVRVDCHPTHQRLGLDVVTCAEMSPSRLPNNADAYSIKHLHLCRMVSKKSWNCLWKMIC